MAQKVYWFSDVKIKSIKILENNVKITIKLATINYHSIGST